MNYWFITRSSQGCSWMSEQRTTNGWTAHKCFVIQKKYKRWHYFATLICHIPTLLLSPPFIFFLCGSPVTDYPISPHLIPNFFPLFSATLSCLFPLRSSFQSFSLQKFCLLSYLAFVLMLTMFTSDVTCVFGPLSFVFR